MYSPLCACCGGRTLNEKTRTCHLCQCIYCRDCLQFAFIPKSKKCIKCYCQQKKYKKTHKCVIL